MESGSVTAWVSTFVGWMNFFLFDGCHAIIIVVVGEINYLVCWLYVVGWLWYKDETTFGDWLF